MLEIEYLHYLHKALDIGTNVGERKVLNNNISFIQRLYVTCSFQLFDYCQGSGMHETIPAHNSC